MAKSRHYNAMKVNEMPELPEVETVRRGLQPYLEGVRIARLILNRDGLRRPFPPDLVQVATGATVTALRRRSKYLLLDLDRGPSILIHLGMSGRMLIEAEGIGGFHRDPAILARHDHVVIETEKGNRITFNDARRFGLIDLIRDETSSILDRLGPEPLEQDFSAKIMAESFVGRRAPVKTLLLDQSIVAGLGNIYASEALHRAGIDPRRAAGEIKYKELEELYYHIREVLTEAIAAGGSSLRDHRQATGELGYFQHGFHVYDRAGQSCLKPGCSGQIQRIVQSGRSSFWCPACQQ